MRQQQKTTVTLSMIWIGLMMIGSRPGWIRNALGFVNGSTDGSKHIANSGGAAPSTGGGGNAGLK